MDSLAGYSSSEDDENSPNPQLPSFTPYLENYAMKQRNLQTCFVYLPWKALPAVTLKLQKCAKTVLSQLQREHPALVSRFQWTFAGANAPTVYGRTGYSNVMSLQQLHVSLFPNLSAEGHRFDQLLRNVPRALKAVEAPTSLVKQLPLSNVDRMTQTKPKKVVALNIKLKLRCMSSSRSGSFFFTVEVAPDLADHQYLIDLSRMCNEQADLLDCEYIWATMLRSETIDDFKYHATLLVGELKSNQPKLSTEEYVTINNIAQNADTETTLELMTIDVDALAISTQGKVREFPLVP